ncbi:MAG: hypothetical protein IT173_10150 [Acidobacteria bacterium]|nr:hypothetical protein [Acidobacteriota bacterium]
MPVLNWIGKEAVVKHHKDVPFRLIELVPELSCSPPYEGGVDAVSADGVVLSSEASPLDVRKSSAFPGDVLNDRRGSAADLSGGIAAESSDTAVGEAELRRTSSGQAAGDLNEDRTQRVHRFSSGFPRRFAEKLRFSDRPNLTSCGSAAALYVSDIKNNTGLLSDTGRAYPGYLKPPATAGGSDSVRMRPYLDFLRPEPPGFLPPPSCLFTVAQARFSASFSETPFFS